METKRIIYYLFIAGLLLLAAEKGMIPLLLLIGVIGFSVYRFFKGRDIERVTSVMLTLLCALILLGARGSFLTALFVMVAMVELIF